MTEREFKRRISQGHGSAVIGLRTCADREKYRPAVMRACLSNPVWDTQSEGTRGKYLYEMIRLLGDSDFFLEPICQKFLATRKSYDWSDSHYIDLLTNFAQDGHERARICLWQKYRELYARLLIKRRLRGFLDHDREIWEHTAIALLQCGGKGSFWDMAEDLGTLLIKNSRYTWWDFEWFLICCKAYLTKKDRKEWERKQQDEPWRHAFLTAFDTANKPVCDSRKESNETWKAVDVYSKIQIQEGQTISVREMRNFGKYGSKEEQQRTVAQIVREKEDDTRAGLLSVFRDVPFPGEHELLISYAMSPNVALREAAWDCLIPCGSEKVRQFALERLTCRENTGEAIRLLIRNYRRQDKEVLLNALAHLTVNRQEESGWHQVVFEILDAHEHGIRLPADLLWYVYENSLCSCCRYRAVRQLGRRHLLTDAVKNECRHDGNADIASYMRRYYPVK